MWGNVSCGKWTCCNCVCLYHVTWLDYIQGRLESLEYLWKSHGTCVVQGFKLRCTSLYMAYQCASLLMPPPTPMANDHHHHYSQHQHQGWRQGGWRCRWMNRGAWDASASWASSKFLFFTRGHRDWKERPAVDFFFSANFSGLTNLCNQACTQI